MKEEINEFISALNKYYHIDEPYNRITNLIWKYSHTDIPKSKIGFIAKEYFDKIGIETCVIKQNENREFILTDIVYKANT